jgi:integrase
MAQSQKRRPRRDKGSGGLHFKHGRDCPKPVEVVDDDGTTRLERPPHKPCVGLWVARVDLGFGGDGKRRTREVSARSRADAIKKLRELRATVDEHGATPTATMTVEQWLTHWLTEKVAVENDPKTLAGYRSAVNTWLIPHLGRLRLDRLEPQHVRDLYKVMRSPGHGRSGKGLAEGSVLKVHNVLAKALSDAMGETTLRRNVTAHIARPKAAKRESSLSEAFARQLLASVQTDPLGARVAAALYTGSRQGEVLGMQWDRIDLREGTLDLAWQLQRLGFVHGCGGTCGRTRAGSCPERQLEVPPGFEHRQLDGGLCLTRPKSEGSRRLIPLPAPLLGWLVARAGFQQGQANPHGLVFTRPDGRPIDPRQDLDHWYAALDRAAVPRVDLHSARHTTATLLDIAGVPRDVTQQIMGHSSALTTKGYIHNTDLTAAREALSRLQIEGPAA